MASTSKGISLAPVCTVLPAIGTSKAAIAGARTTVTSLPRLVGLGVAVARVVTSAIAHSMSVCTKTVLADKILAASGHQTAEQWSDAASYDLPRTLLWTEVLVTYVFGRPSSRFCVMLYLCLEVLVLVSKLWTPKGNAHRIRV